VRQGVKFGRKRELTDERVREIRALCEASVYRALADGLERAHFH
jgi:hypothetical protein